MPSALSILRLERGNFIMLQGIAASAGVGIGTALRVIPVDVDYTHVTPAGPDADKPRLSAALDAFISATAAMAEAAKARVGEHQAEILTGQVTMISDPFMKLQMEEKLDAGMCAEAAVDAVCQDFMDMFTATGDELMMQRATDVGDIRFRLLCLLLGRENTDLSELPDGTVLVVHELTPSMATGLDRAHVAGVVTETGGATSHSAILARSMELPAVLSVPDALGAMQDGQSVIVDGGKGAVLVDPEAKILADYRAKVEAQRADKLALEAFRGKETRTADGANADLYGNIGSADDAKAVFDATGEGVGLFRTEFLFMDRTNLPTEEEQFQVYKQVAQMADGREVIIRTLDVGGDKEIPYLGMEKEENPFLGFRAIRYCLERWDVFETQLRALLRASAFGKVKIMLPLVTRVSEVRQAKALLETLKGGLEQNGVAYDKNVRVGVMVETPAACLMADVLAKEADFFSIGTNDLTQYIMVADRGNQAVASIGSPLDPAVLRGIQHIIACGKKAGIPVGMCGEAAANPLMIPLLLSFGLDEFSVGSASILATRRRIAQWTKAGADALTERVMALDAEEDVKALLIEKVK